MKRHLCGLLQIVAASIALSTVGSWVAVAWVRPQLQQHYSQQAMYLVNLMWNSQVQLFEAIMVGALAVVASRVVVGIVFRRKAAE